MTRLQHGMRSKTSGVFVLFALPKDNAVQYLRDKQFDFLGKLSCKLTLQAKFLIGEPIDTFFILFRSLTKNGHIIM